jgi:branched-chain amino acid transport system permease protein
MTTAAVRPRIDAAVRRPGAARLGIALLLVAYVLVTGQVAQTTLYTQGLVLTAAVFGILAVSLDMVAGMAGLYSLGHAGLFAIGAYTTTLLNEHYGWNVFALLPLSMAGAGLAGIVLGTLSLRVSGLYFAITTFVFTLVVGVVASDAKFTGGLQGISGPLFPEFPAGLAGLGSAVVWGVSACLLVTVAVAWNIRRSAMYPVLLAIRDAEPFAAAAGVRTPVVKVALFGLSASLAGLAGWAFSFLGFVSPGQFGWTVSVNILVMVILGGMNTTVGPIVGAAFISVFPVYVHIDPLLQETVFGCVFVLVIVFAPGGVVGVLRTAARRWIGGPGAGASPASAESEGPQASKSPQAPQAPQATEVPGAPAATVRDLVEEGLAAGAPASGTAPAVECRGIRFSYVRGVRALDGVDFVVRPGTVHGLIGPNGSGKSTLVDLISGRITPDEGTISLGGRRVERLGAAARPAHGLTRTFQTAVLVRELRARENVAIGLYDTVPRIGVRAVAWPLLPGARRDSRSMAARAGTALHRVGMAGWRDTRVGDAPHGVEQLVQLAAACAAGPSVLVLDEPLAGLSPGEVAQVTAILGDLRRAGVTVIVIEHQTRFVFETCDEVTVLAAGELVATGPAAAVRADARVREVYLGQ